MKSKGICTGWRRTRITPGTGGLSFWRYQTARIDIWWRNDATGRLSLLLAHLMKQTRTWEDASLRVMSVEERHASEEGRENLAREINDARIDADLELQDTPDMKQVIELSSQSDMVFLPFRFRSDEIITLFDRPAAELMRWMSTTVLIQAAEDIDLDAEPESGEAGRRAEVLDELEEARQNASNAEKAAQEAAERAKAAQARITELETSEGSEKEARNTEMEADKAMRKAAKAAARLASIEKEAEAFESPPPEGEQNDNEDA